MKLFSLILFFGLLVTSASAQYLGLKDFTFTPDSIDVRTGAKTITFTVTATETDNVTILFRPIGFSAIGAEQLERIGNGVFQKTVTYRVDSPSRTDEIYEIQLIDSKAGLGEFYTTTDIAALGFKTSYQIISDFRINPPKSRKRVRFF